MQGEAPDRTFASFSLFWCSYQRFWLRRLYDSTGVGPL